MKINVLFCSLSLPSPVSHPAMLLGCCPIPQPTRSQHEQHYHTSYKTSTQRHAPSHSQLLTKARFFQIISYKLSVIREVCMSLKWLATKFESIWLRTQMHPALAIQQAVPVTLYLSSPAVPFFLFNFCHTTVTQWSKEKKETVTSQTERNCH